MYRFSELKEATNGFFETSNRLDRAGSPNSAYLGMLPSVAMATAPSAEDVPVAVRSYGDLCPGQIRLCEPAAAAMAEVRHPNVLPLLGVCADTGHAVYSLMQVRKGFRPML